MLSCLIAEDEAFTGMALADAVAEADFRVLGPFSRCSAVLDTLDQVTPDAAILDVALRDGSSIAIALALRERSVPFVIYSAHISQMGEFGTDRRRVAASWRSALRPTAWSGLLRHSRNRPVRSGDWSRELTLNDGTGCTAAGATTSSTAKGLSGNKSLIWRSW